VLREGAYADLTLFDAETIDSAPPTRSDRAGPRHRSVIVTAAVVWQGGKPTGSRPGRVPAARSGAGGTLK